LSDGSAVVITSGARHNVVNSSATESLRLYTLYSPPEHPDGTVQHTKADETAAKAAATGKAWGKATGGATKNNGAISWPPLCSWCTVQLWVYYRGTISRQARLSASRGECPDISGRACRQRSATRSATEWIAARRKP